MPADVPVVEHGGPSQNGILSRVRGTYVSDGAAQLPLAGKRARKRRNSLDAPTVTLLCFDILVHEPLVKPRRCWSICLPACLSWRMYVGVQAFSEMVNVELQSEGVMEGDSIYLPSVRSDSLRKIKRPRRHEGRVWRDFP